jgi:CheY-like chemotaxis protein
VTFTEPKHEAAPFPQTLAETALARHAPGAWETVPGFSSETSAQSASPFREPRAEWAPSPELPPLVLLAHADEVRRSGLAWELGAQGCTVVEVEDGLELLDYLDDDGPWLPLPRPDVIVTELDMPGFGGLEAARRLREAGDPTPIIFINVSRAPAAAAAAARLPACRMVHGDVEGGVLRAAVEDALRGRAA